MKLENKLKEVDLRELNSDFAELTSGYVSVKTSDMFPGTSVVEAVVLFTKMEAQAGVSSSRAGGDPSDGQTVY